MHFEHRSDAFLYTISYIDILVSKKFCLFVCCLFCCHFSINPSSLRTDSGTYMTLMKQSVESTFIDIKIFDSNCFCHLKYFTPCQFLICFTDPLSLSFSPQLSPCFQPQNKLVPQPLPPGRKGPFFLGVVVLGSGRFSLFMVR